MRGEKEVNDLVLYAYLKIYNKRNCKSKKIYFIRIYDIENVVLIIN